MIFTDLHIVWYYIYVILRESKGGGNMNGLEGKKAKKMSIFNTIRFRMLALVLGCIFISGSVCYLVTVPRFSNQVIHSVQSNIADMTKYCSALVDQRVSGMGTMVETTVFSSVLEDVKVNGIDGSYAYLVDSKGVIMYHPDVEKVGEQVENKAVQDIVKRIDDKDLAQSDVIKYTYRGKVKYAGYCISPKTKYITIVTADREEILTPVNKTKISAMKGELLVCLVLLLLAYAFAGNIINGIKKLAMVFDKAARLDLQEDKDVLNLCNRKDEIGIIAKKYRIMQENLKGIVTKINDTSEQLLISSNKLISNISSVHEHSKENSSTSQDMAAGMQETTANIDVINNNVADIEESTNRIKEKTHTGTELANTIKERAVELEEDTLRASKKANDVFKEVKIRSEEAIEKSKAVEKIEVLSSSIMDIADQTSLLALNASIEAARAGELGKGFGVVANEISTLANQSASTVSDISAIVSDVTEAVTNISECLETTMHFFEKNVTRDYQNFRNCSIQYSEDAKDIQESMDNINVDINELSSVTKKIATAVAEIAGTMNEAAEGVTHIAEKTSDVVELVKDTSQTVEENEKFAQDLKQIVSRFEV